jgi:hypothetical protein
VKLRDGPAAAESLQDERQLHLQRIEVLGRTLVVFGDDLVAGAVKAKLLAERNMHVQRKRRSGISGPVVGECLDRIGRVEIGRESVGCRI